MDDPRFQVLTHDKNRGLGAARNTGFRNARGSLVAMLDADDRLHPDYLRVMTAALQESPDNAWAWPDIELFGAKSGEWRLPDAPVALCPAHLSYHGGSSFIPVSLWAAAGGFVEDPLLTGLEDLDFWLGALEVGAGPIYVHDLLYQWRISPDSMTFRVSPDSHLQMEEIYRRRRSVLDGASPCPECAGAEPSSVFLARGYFNSSVHARRSGHSFRSLRLAIRGWSLNPADVSIRRHLTRLMIPRRLIDLRRRMS